MLSLKIHEQIAFLRRQKGVTQEQLAQTLGVTNQSVSKWESGQCCPDIQLLPALAAYFGVTTDELLGCNNPESLRNVYLSIKDLFSASPAEESFSLAFKLATLLHEGAVSKGYKSHIPWDAGKQYGLDSEPVKWGWSVCSEPEGSTMHVSNSIFFSDQKYWQTPKASDIASIYNSLTTLCDLNLLKTLFALFELTVSDFENLYVTADEIAVKSKCGKDTTLKALERLPVETVDREGEPAYRLDSKWMHLPPLLMLLSVA
jgi:transcriptional regulator with XRE-family HTH domain